MSMPSLPWPKVSGRLVRALLSGHSSLGLIAAALLYVVCLSGTILVFDHALKRWEQPDSPVSHGLTPHQAERAVHLVYKKSQAIGVLKDVFIWPPTDDTGRLVLHVMDFPNGIDEKWVLNPDGSGLEPYQTPFADFLSALHINLHLPRTPGTMLVGLLGVMLLGAILSGLMAHPRIFKDAFSLRWGGAKRLQEADLHNRLGVWGLPFHIAISLSGAILGLSFLVLGALAFAVYDGDFDKAGAAIGGPRVTIDRSPAPLPPIAAPLTRLLNANPGATIDRIRIGEVGTRGQKVTLYLAQPGHLSLHERYFLDAQGNLIGNAGFTDGPLGQQILAALPAVHTGWFGGPIIKAAYAILGVALIIIVVTSVSIWVARRKDKGQPVPRWQRLWIAFVWGQPVAMTGTALAALFAPDSRLLAFYLGLTGLALIPALPVADAARLSRGLRSITAIALLLLACAHLILWAGHIRDWLAWIVDGVFIAAGLGLVASVVSDRSKVRPSVAFEQAPAE